MHFLILGYGFSGYYCAKKLLDDGHQVTAISRNYREDYSLNKLQHICSDVRKLNINFKPNGIIYCAPPPSEGAYDTLLTETLAELARKNLVANIVYWGSSGVYGDHLGGWVDEGSVCHIDVDIQRRRLDAEKKIQSFAKTNKIMWSVLRVAGMFGPGRMPSTANSVIYLNEAPYSNLVYVEDVAYVATQAVLKNKTVGMLNVSDGLPKKMGTLQRIVANHKGDTLTEQSYEEVMKSASPMRRYFLGASKRLSNSKCLSIFPEIVFADFEKTVIKCLIK